MSTPTLDAQFREALWSRTLRRKRALDVVDDHLRSAAAQLVQADMPAQAIRVLSLARDLLDQEVAELKRLGAT